MNIFIVLVLGFCGRFYAVQYALPINQLLRQASQQKNALRFRIAKSLLDLVRQFENKKIYMCDVKLVSLLCAHTYNNI